MAINLQWADSVLASRRRQRESGMRHAQPLVSSHYIKGSLVKRHLRDDLQPPFREE